MQNCMKSCNSCRGNLTFSAESPRKILFPCQLFRDFISEIVLSPGVLIISFDSTRHISQWIVLEHTHSFMGNTIFGTGYTHWHGVLVCCGHFTFTRPPCVTKMQKLPYLPDAVVPLLLHVTSEFYFHTAFPPIFSPFRYQCFKLFLDMFSGY